MHRPPILKRLSPALACLFVLCTAGCKPFSGPLAGAPAGSPFFVQHAPGQGEFTYSLDLGSQARSVYFTFTNPDPLNAAATSPTVFAEDLPSAKGLALGTNIPQPPGKAQSATPQRVMDFNRTPFSRTGALDRLARMRDSRGVAVLNPDTVGNTATMYDTLDSNSEYDFQATCRYAGSAIDVGTGQTRKLNIWVQDACWSSPPGSKTYLIDQPLVDALAARFLASGAFNDIYDWVTTMIGREWGTHPYIDLIPPSSEITILLCDIENDNSPDGGVIGFFWAKDNFKNSYVYQPDPLLPNYFPHHSHERIMFYIDAVMIANPSPPGYWADEVASTLAHEFQHMINFYQKSVVAGAAQGPDTWINEMCSQAVEDLVADKLLVPGPRGVAGSVGSAGLPNNPEGRLPLFNAYPSVSLSDWGRSGTLQSYSASYAFGAYLARNYAGAQLLRAIVQSPRTGPDQITSAVVEVTGVTVSLDSLLQKWSLAVLLSDRTDALPGYRFNTGGFMESSAGGELYRLGSINFFNYQRYGTPGATGPRLYSGSGPVGGAPPLPASGLLYSAGDTMAGSRTWKVTLPAGTALSVVVR